MRAPFTIWRGDFHAGMANACSNSAALDLISENDRLADYVTLDGARFCAERVLAPRIYEGGGTSPLKWYRGEPVTHISFTKKNEEKGR